MDEVDGFVLLICRFVSLGSSTTALSLALRSYGLISMMRKCKKAVHTPAEVCSCMDTLFATPKTVHTPAEVFSLRSEFEGGPKTVHTPAEVCSLKSEFEGGPKTVRSPAEVCSLRSAV